MQTLKNVALGFYGYVIVALMTLISLIIYISNVNKPYYQDMNSNVVMMLVGALVSAIVVIALTLLKSNRILTVVSDLLRVVLAALIIVAGVTFIGMRVESFGYIFGSNLELGNEAAFTAGTQAIFGIVVFMATWILSVVTSFMNVRKSK